MEPFEQSPGARNVAKSTKGKTPRRQERAAQVIERKNSTKSSNKEATKTLQALLTQQQKVGLTIAALYSIACIPTRIHIQ